MTKQKKQFLHTLKEIKNTTSPLFLLANTKDSGETQYRECLQNTPC
jgi:hypothetical protein